jgi:hypothetical protein
MQKPGQSGVELVKKELGLLYKIFVQETSGDGLLKKGQADPVPIGHTEAPLDCVCDLEYKKE